MDDSATEQSKFNQPFKENSHNELSRFPRPQASSTHDDLVFEIFSRLSNVWNHSPERSKSVKFSIEKSLKIKGEPQEISKTNYESNKPLIDISDNFFF